MDADYLRTLFLHPPSPEGFDGGAGARYQAKREIRSFWFPTWLAQPAAMVPGSRLVDAPPDGLTLDDIRPLARQYDLCVMHTSTPSFPGDVKIAEALKAENSRLVVGMVGAAVAVGPDASLRASTALDFVAGNEFDFTIQEVAQGRALRDVQGLSYRVNGRVEHTPARPILENMDLLPFVTPVYKRDLTVEHYAIGYLKHPYVSLYTGRGCRSKCTFCLWPQTVGGQRYRTRSVEHVAEEMALAQRLFPHPYETLKVLKDNGLRLLLVGYESGNQQILNNIKKGIRLDLARRFTRDCKALGITIHGTFILGLPGETRETIQETIRFACDIDPTTIQVSLAAPYPGTALYAEAQRNGWIETEELVDDSGVQVSAIGYPHLTRTEIYRSVDEVYRRFYFRPRKMLSLGAAMLRDRELMRRRIQEGRDFLRFLRKHRAETPIGA